MESPRAEISSTNGSSSSGPRQLLAGAAGRGCPSRRAVPRAGPLSGLRRRRHTPWHTRLRSPLSLRARRPGLGNFHQTNAICAAKRTHDRQVSTGIAHLPCTLAGQSRTTGAAAGVGPWRMGRAAPARVRPPVGAPSLSLQPTVLEWPAPQCRPGCPP